MSFFLSSYSLSRQCLPVMISVLPFIPTLTFWYCRKRRWVLAESWEPCAIGMLPSPNDPCGRRA